MGLSVRFDAATYYALNAQSILLRSNAKVMEQMATGLRVNRASDDAAGLAVSEGLRTQARAAQVARRNIQDAISLFRIQEGTLGQIGDMLQRMRELALQAANGTLTDTERVYLNNEAAALVEQIDRFASRKPMNGTFAMDGTYGKSQRTTNTATEAIHEENSIRVTDPTLVGQLFGKLLEVEILQQSVAQEFQDSSIRSDHVQETLTSFADSVLVNTTVLTGTTSGNRNDKSITLTAPADDSPDSLIQLVRSHDGGIVTDPYAIPGGSAAHSGNFTVDISGPASTNGVLYSVTGEVLSTNASGQGSIGETEVENINRVQVDKFADQTLTDADGAVSLSRGDATGIDSVLARNWSEQILNDADGAMNLSRSDASGIDRIEAKNASEQILGDADGDMTLGRTDINAIGSVETKNWSEQFAADADGIVSLSKSDANAMNEIQAKNWSDRITNDADGVMNISRADANSMDEVLSKNWSEQQLADADGLITLSRNDANAMEEIQIKNWAEQFAADADGVVTLSRGDAVRIDKIETKNFSEDFTSDADGAVTLSRTDANAIDQVRAKNFSDQYLADADGDVTLLQASANGINTIETRNNSERWISDVDGTVALSRSDATAMDKVEAKSFSERFAADADGQVVLSRADATGIDRVQAKNKSDIYTGDADGMVTLSRSDADSIDKVETKSYSERFAADADGAVTLSRADATGINRVQTKNNSELFAADADGDVTLSRTDATAITSVEAKSASERFAADADGAVTLSRADATGINRVQAKNWSEQFTADPDGAVTLSRTDATAMDQVETHSYSERFAADADGAVVLSRGDATAINRVQAKNNSELFSADADGVVTLSRADATAMTSVEAKSYSERFTADADGDVTLSRADAAGMDRVMAKNWSEQFAADADGIVTLSRTDAASMDKVEVWNGISWDEIKEWDDAAANVGDTVYKWDGAQGLTVGELEADMTTITPTAAPYTIWASYSTTEYVELADKATGTTGETVYEWDGTTGLSVGRLTSGGTIDSVGPYDIEAAYSTTEFVTLTEKTAASAGDTVYEWDGATGVTVGVLADDGTIEDVGTYDVIAAYETSDWVSVGEKAAGSTGDTVYEWNGTTGLTVGKLAADGTIEAAGPYDIEASYDVSNWVEITDKASGSAGDTVYEWDGATGLTVGVLADDGAIEDTTDHDVWATYSTSDWVTLAEKGSGTTGETVYEWDGTTGITVGRLTSGATINAVGPYDIEAAYSTSDFVSLTEKSAASAGDTVYEWDNGTGITVGVLADDGTIADAGTYDVIAAYQTSDWVTLTDKASGSTGDTVYEWDGTTGLTVGKLAADGTIEAAGPYDVEAAYDITDYTAISAKAAGSAGDTVYEWDGGTGLTVGILADDGTLEDATTHDVSVAYGTTDWVEVVEKGFGSTGDTVYEWDGTTGLTVGKLAADGTIEAAGPYDIEAAYSVSDWVTLSSKAAGSAGDTVYEWDGSTGLTVGVLRDDGTIDDTGTFDIQAAYTTSDWFAIGDKAGGSAGDTVYEYDGSTGVSVGRLKDDGTLETIGTYDIWAGYSTSDWITLAEKGAGTTGQTVYEWDGAQGLSVGRLASDNSLEAAGPYDISTAYSTDDWVAVAEKSSGNTGDTVYEWDGTTGITVGQLQSDGTVQAVGPYDMWAAYGTSNWITLSEKAVGTTGDNVYEWDGSTGLTVGKLKSDGTIDSAGPYDVWAAYATDNYVSLAEKGAGTTGQTVYEWDGAQQLTVGKLASDGTIQAAGPYNTWAAYSTDNWITLSDSAGGTAGDTVYKWDGSTGLTVGRLEDDGTTVSGSGVYDIWAAYSTDGWNELSEKATGVTGETVYEWDGVQGLTVGKLASDGTMQAVGPYDTWAAYSIENWVTLSDKASGGAGETVYEWDGSDGITIGKLDSDNSVDAAGPYDAWASYSTNGWVTLAEKGSGTVGETVYEWDGGTGITVGKLKSDGTIEAAPNYDVTTLYSISGSADINSLSDSTFDRELVYTHTPGSNTITIGQRTGGGIDAVGVIDAEVDYEAWENEYTLTYESYNKFQMSGAGAVISGGQIQFAEGQYTGSDVPADNNGFAGIEMRVDGTATGDYTYYDTYGGLNNVVVFDSAPTNGSTISMDYTTPTGDPVDWSSATTIGEDTTCDGTITPGESSSKDGVFNDFFSSHGTDSITITQPGRGQSMTLDIDPSWTIAQFIDAFNAQAETDDVEAEAYWDAGSSEVRIRPGTSGWKDRDITGWGGPEFRLEGPIVSPNATNLGGGSTGDIPTAQNQYSISEVTAPVQSRIIVREAETGTVLEDSTSDWNHHELSSLGFSIDVYGDVPVGTTSQFYVRASQLQIGLGGSDDDWSYFQIPDVSTEALGVDSIDMTTQDGAREAIDDIDDAIHTVNQSRGYFGTEMNRLEKQAINLMNLQTNLTASESGIRDADYAAVTMQFARNNIIMQTGLAMLAQANLQREGLLSLVQAL